MQKILLVFASFLWMNTVGQPGNECSSACAEKANAAGNADKENAEAECEVMLPYFGCLKTNEKCKSDVGAKKVLAASESVIKGCEEDDHGHDHGEGDSASSTYSSVGFIVASVLAVKLF